MEAYQSPEIFILMNSDFHLKKNLWVPFMTPYFTFGRFRQFANFVGSIRIDSEAPLA